MLEKLIQLASYGAAHYQEAAAALVAACGGLIGFFMLIPGAQPEGFLQKCVDFLSKYSRK